MGMTETEWEKELATVEKDAAARAQEQVKLYFILQKIAELEHVDADELEVDKRLQAMAQQSQRPIEEVRRVFEEDVRDSFREKKTVDLLIANAKFEETERSAT